MGILVSNKIGLVQSLRSITTRGKYGSLWLNNTNKNSLQKYFKEDNLHSQIKNESKYRISILLEAPSIIIM